MPTPPIPRADLKHFAECYRQAIAEGHVPAGSPVGTGRRSAVHVASEKAGINTQSGRRRIKACRAAGLIDNARRAALRGEVGGPPIPPIAVPPEGFIVDRNGGAYDAAGNLLKQWVGTRRDSGEVYVVPAGHVIKGESAYLDPDGRVIGKWVKTRESEADGLIDALRAAFSDTAGLAPPIEAPASVDADILTIYPVPDLHFGMLAWAPETGTNYDARIAADMALGAIRDLVAQSKPSEHAELILLGDYFHANDTNAETPESKHRLDVDGRWQKVLFAGARLARGMIEILASKHAFVTVRCLKGNHDRDSAVALAMGLAMFYEGHERITIDEDASIVWYRRFGRSLLAATHGHTMKPDRMAMMMAVDRPEDWGATLFKAFFFGHIHHETAKEVMGVRVESFSSPAARDAYAADHGFRSGRALNALTYHRERGEIGRHRVNL